MHLAKVPSHGGYGSSEGQAGCWTVPERGTWCHTLLGTLRARGREKLPELVEVHCPSWLPSTLMTPVTPGHHMPNRGRPQ